MVTQDIQIAIVGAGFVENVVGAVPLIEHFLDKILSLAEFKPHWPLVRLAAFGPARADAASTIAAMVQRAATPTTKR